MELTSLQTSTRYGAIMADPPWKFMTWSKRGMGKSADRHYATMTYEDIAALPIGDLAAKDCILFLWVTNPTLLHGLALTERWGFKYKTKGFSWVKLNSKAGEDAGWTERSFFMGMGYWSSANGEDCLIATRGKPKRLSKGVRQLLIAPRREHSRKPDEVHGRVEKLVAGPYLELFARSERQGWDCWGNEVGRYSKPG